MPVKCKKCQSVAVVKDDDGPLGVRFHCLTCGHIWPVKPESGEQKP